MMPNTPSDPSDQLAQVGPGRRGRGAAEVEHPGGGDHAQTAHHIVEPAVPGGILAGGPGGGEPADGGELETLREMPEREAAGTEQFLGARAGDPGAEFGLAGHLVETVQGIEAAQIQRDDGGEITAFRVQAAHHAGAATERDDRDPAFAADPQDLGHIVLIGREQHGVRCVLNAGILAAQQIQRRLTAGPQQPARIVDPAERRSDRALQCVPVGVGQRGRTDPDVGDVQIRRRRARRHRAPASAVP